MWYIKTNDLSNRGAVTLLINDKMRDRTTIIVSEVPKVHKNRPITSFHHAFEGMQNLTEVIFDDTVDLSDIDDTRCMFNKCPKLERVVFPPNAFHNIYDCSYMFQSCPMLKEVIAPNIFISPETNKISRSIHYFDKMLNGTNVDRNNLPRSINCLVAISAA
jgi:hypothetical protein